MARQNHSSTSRTGRPGHTALLRLVAALAVMLLAVLPHATLAASALHAAARVPSPTLAGPHDHHAVHQTQVPTPCHEDDGQPAKPGPSMPSCCSLGCGLLGSAPVVDEDVMATHWRLLAPVPALAVAEAAPEPAERPPRRAAH